MTMIRTLIAALGVAALVPAQDSPPPLPEGAETKTTESGLKYTVIEEGEGEPTAAPGDLVRAHYTGWLKSDGTKFDSSRDRGQPFPFKVGQGVIAGWSEGIQLMPVGATYRFEIPPELAYGAQGRGAIPANSTLLFDIELVEVVEEPVMPPADPEAQKTLEEGIVYEVLEEGEGASPKEDDILVLDIALFQPSGELLESTKMAGRSLRAKASDLSSPVLQKMPSLMKVGGKVRVQASKEKGVGPSAPPQIDETVWVIELKDIVKPLDVPEFSKPPEEELQSSDSGLKWKVVKEGEGESPSKTDTVKVHYAGRLLDGTVFDSSFQRGEPIEFPLSGVIPGWTEGVSMMKPGETRILVVPPDLAYGERGSPPTIGPNATLVFWVELLEVKR